MPAAPVQISPVEEEDFQILAPIQYRALHPLDTLHMLIYPSPAHPIPQDVIDKTAQRHIATLNEGRGKGLHWLKASSVVGNGNGDTGETILGTCKWYFFLSGEGGQYKWKDSSPPPPPPSWVQPSRSPASPNLSPGVDDLAYVSYIMRSMDSFRAKNFTGPGILLDLLYVDPAAQGRGIGRKLVEWGTSQADEKGVRVWVEASYRARGLYEKCGFSVIEDVRLDSREAFGDEGWREEWEDYKGNVGFYFMVREPKTSKS